MRRDAIRYLFFAVYTETTSKCQENGVMQAKLTEYAEIDVG